MEKLKALIQIVLFIGYFLLGLFQLAAIMTVFTDMGLHWLIAGPISFFLSYFPLLGGGLAIYGAVSSWHWSILKAVGIFYGPLLAMALLVFVVAMITDNIKRRNHRKMWGG